jgi:hypothetical protein
MIIREDLQHAIKNILEPYNEEEHALRITNRIINTGKFEQSVLELLERYVNNEMEYIKKEFLDSKAEDIKTISVEGTEYKILEIIGGEVCVRDINKTGRDSIEFFNLDIVYNAVKSTSSEKVLSKTPLLYYKVEVDLTTSSDKENLYALEFYRDCEESRNVLREYGINAESLQDFREDNLETDESMTEVKACEYLNGMLEKYKLTSIYDIC